MTKTKLGLGVVAGGILGLALTFGNGATSQQVEMWRKVGQTIYPVPSTLSVAIGNIADAIRTDGSVTQSYTNATSTSATTATLVQADMSYSSRSVTPNTGALTYTLPATSTLTTFIPTAGDMARQCFYNATSTAAATITFAAGTGIDLEVATSTSQTGAFDLTIGAGNMGCFDFFRKPNTDIVAGFLEYSDAD